MPTVRLTWTDLNSGPSQEDEFRVYRSTSSFDGGSLPSVMATLAADVELYDDATAANDTTYYYAVAAVKGSVLAISFLTVVVGSPADPADGIEYFLGRNSSLQALTTSGTTEIAFGTEVYDTNSVFGGNRFTVSPSMDGFYALLMASVDLDPSRAQNSSLAIQVSTDSGSSWTSVVGQDVNPGTKVGVATHVLLADGDIYRVVFVNGASSQDAVLSTTVQFGAIIVEPIP